jgi:hypothetical protein
MFKMYLKVDSFSPTIKIMWFVFIILGIASVSFFISKSVLDYLSWDVITSIDVRIETSMVFPAVTLCFEDDKSYNLREILIECSFNNITCDTNDFETVKIFSYTGNTKNCFKFNGGKNSVENQTKSFRETYKTNHFDGLKIGFYFTSSAQVYYYVGENLQEPTYDDFFHRLGKGNKRYLILDKLVQKKLEYPYNQCTANSEIKGILMPNILSRGNFSYTQEKCFQICCLRYLSSKCNCTYPDQEAVPRCDDKYACFNIEYRSFDFAKICDQTCPLECDITYYTVTKEGIDFDPTREQYRIFKEWLLRVRNISGLTNEKISKDITYLNFFFEHIKSTEITQLPKMTFPDLVSNIGGTLGTKKIH